MATFEQIETAARRYLTAEIIPHIPEENWQGSLSKMGSGAFAFLIIRNKRKEFEAQAEQLRAAGILDSQGELDVEFLAEAAKQFFPQSGQRIEIKGLPPMTFKPSDVDVLLSYVEGVNA